MAAMPEPDYGINPETMEPAPMPGQDPVAPEVMEMLQGAGVDPDAQVDPMLLNQHGGDDAPYGDVVEVEKREKVEYRILCAIDALAAATEAGNGAENMDFALKAAQAGSYWGQVYAALTQAEYRDEHTQE